MKFSQRIDKKNTVSMKMMYNFDRNIVVLIKIHELSANE